MVALEHFKNNASKYSLIIPDVKMPSTTGPELAKHAKKIKTGHQGDGHDGI